MKHSQTSILLTVTVLLIVALFATQCTPAPAGPLHPLHRRLHLLNRPPRLHQRPRPADNRSRRGRRSRLQAE